MCKSLKQVSINIHYDDLSTLGDISEFSGSIRMNSKFNRKSTFPVKSIISFETYKEKNSRSILRKIGSRVYFSLIGSNILSTYSWNNKCSSNCTLEEISSDNKGI